MARAGGRSLEFRIYLLQSQRIASAHQGIEPGNGFEHGSRQGGRYSRHASRIGFFPSATFFEIGLLSAKCPLRALFLARDGRKQWRGNFGKCGNGIDKRLEGQLGVERLLLAFRVDNVAFGVQHCAIL